MKSIYKIIFGLIVLAIHLEAQTPENIVSTPNPNVSALIDFQEQNINLSSGAPNISIPIYNLQDIDMNSSISLRYNPKGVQLDNHPSWVGMNWNLNAGGVITRKTNGLPDETQWKEYFIFHDSDPNLDSTIKVLGYGYFYGLLDNSDWHTQNSIESYIANQSVELEPDEFSFSFGDYSGSFYLDHKANWIVVGSPEIKVEVEDTLIQISSPRVYDQNPSVGGSFPPADRQFTEIKIRGFKITTPDGFQYEFGLWNRPQSVSGKDGVEPSINFFQKSYIGENWNTWHLTKVVSPDKTQEIRYEYEFGDPIASFNRTIARNQNSGQSQPGGIFGIFGPIGSSSTEIINRYEGNIIYPLYLSKITSKNYIIVFHRSKTEELTYDYSAIVNDLFLQFDSYRPSLHSIPARLVLGVSSPNAQNQFVVERKDINPSAVLNDDYAESFYSNIILPNSGVFWNPSKLKFYEYINFDRLQWSKLDSIKIHARNSNDLLKTTVFKYANTSTERLRLKSVQEKGTDGSEIPPYKFYYEDFDENKYPGSFQLPGYLSGKIDHWGYFNGLNSTWPISLNSSSMASYYSSRNPNSTYLYTGVLNRIKLPTGGNIKYIYEPKYFEKEIKRDSLSGAFSVVASVPGSYGDGLRIKKVTYDDGTSNPDIVKKYSYELGILGSKPIYYWPDFKGKFKNGNTYNSSRFVTQSLTPLNPATQDGSHVSYSKITVKNAENYGKSEYYFSNYQTHPSSLNGIQYYLDENFLATIDLTLSPRTPFSSLALLRGQLLEKRDYESGVNGQNLLRYKEVNEYSRSTYGNTKIRFMGYEEYEILGGTAIQAATHVHNVYNPNLTKTTRWTYDENGSNPVVDSTVYTYGTLNLLRNEKKINSNEDVYETKYEYVFDIYQAQWPIYADLTARHQFFPPRKIEHYVNGELIAGKEMLFRYFDANGVTGNNIPLSSLYPHLFREFKRTWDINGLLLNGSWVTEKTINKYDLSIGKATNIKQRGWQPTTYAYSPFGKILNSSFEDFDVFNFYNSNTMLLDSTIDIDGQNRQFKWDDLRRLKSITARNGHVTTLYDYRYGSPGTGNRIEEKIVFSAVQGSELNQQIKNNYLNGFGKGVQLVYQAHSPNQLDVSQIMEYDSLGRLSKKYEPLETINNTGDYATNIPSNLPFTEIKYESSPLNREISTIPPNWYPDSVIYSTNLVNEVFDHRKRNYYPKGSLIKTVLKDRDGKITELFKDLHGKIVLSRLMASGGGTDTYFVYDQKDRLTHIIPPNNFGVLLNHPNVYSMVYDSRDRVITKKIPGKDTIRFIYDDRDLMTYKKDGIQPWVQYIYDKYGRVRERVLKEPNQPPTKLLCRKYYDGTTSIEKGKLTKEVVYLPNSQDSLVKVFGYDEFGRNTSIHGNHIENLGNDNAWKENMSYDFSDNIIKHEREFELLSGKKVTYCDSITYDHEGRKKNHFYRLNNVTTCLSESQYTIKDELKKLKLGVSNSTVLQDLDYQYLDNGYLKRINTPAVQSLLITNTDTACISPLDNCSFGSTSSLSSSNDLFYLELSYDQLLHPDLDSRPRKDGFISQMTWRVPGIRKQAYGYHYDDHNRLKNANYAEICNANNSTSNINFGFYDVDITYHDKRGNIATLKRQGWANENICPKSNTIDLLTYNYEGTSDRVSSIDDAGDTNFRHHGFPSKVQANYIYDDNGNVLYDPSRDITSHYFRFNLPDTITKGNGEKVIISYCENGTKKRQQRFSSDGYQIEDRYYIENVEVVNGDIESIHHSEGRVINTSHAGAYYLSDTIVDKDLYIKALRIITKSCIGSMSNVVLESCDSILHLPGFEVLNTGNNSYEAKSGGCAVGGYQYEYYIKDHLGNIRVVFSDRDGDGYITASNNSASNEVLEMRSYYPFGLEHYNRNSSGIKRPDEALKNRFGYNSKEKIVGTDYLFFGTRTYDPSIGRFLQTDMISSDFPHVSTFNYAENEPIANIDLHGMQAVSAVSLGSDVKYRGERLKNSISGATHKNIKSNERATGPLVSHLKKISANDVFGIGFVAIFSHGQPERIFGINGWGNGISNNDIKQIKEAVKNKEIKFAEGASIYLGGCHAGSCYDETNPEEYQSFAQTLSNATGVSVVAAVNDRVGPKDESGDNLVYETEFPAREQFHRFIPNKNSTPIGNAVDVKELQKETDQSILLNAVRKFFMNR